MKDLERFGENSRRQIVAEVLAGTMSKEQARKIYGIKSKSAILEWMRIFAGFPRNSSLDPVPLLKTMSEEKDKIVELNTKILQLEEELKLSRLKGKAFKIMVDIAKEDYGLDLEKKSGVKQSRNSK